MSEDGLKLIATKAVGEGYGLSVACKKTAKCVTR